MKLAVSPYQEQVRRWPGSGPHLLAQHDAETIVVYQAYRPATGHYAAAHGHFGGEYSFGRMNWIKPNFLWMMFRSGWGTKQDQEVTLALRLRRSGFERLLKNAVASAFGASIYGTQGEWKATPEYSDVRLQWDPDHDPAGTLLERRSIQLAPQGQTLRRLNDE